MTTERHAMATGSTAQVVDELVGRNAAFAATADGADVAELTMLPRGRRIIVSCVDPRVDPAVIMGVPLGEAAIIRNVGGRVTQATLRTLALLAAITRTNGGRPGPGWNLVVVQHTDCGITHLLDYPDVLAAELGITPGELDPETIRDPRASLVADLAAVHANPMLPRGLIVSGLLYDTGSGRLETVIAPQSLDE